jgi:hypothetical protein
MLNFRYERGITSGAGYALTCRQSALSGFGSSALHRVGPGDILLLRIAGDSNKSHVYMACLIDIS